MSPDRQSRYCNGQQSNCSAFRSSITFMAEAHDCPKARLNHSSCTLLMSLQCRTAADLAVWKVPDKNNEVPHTSLRDQRHVAFPDNLIQFQLLFLSTGVCDPAGQMQWMWVMLWLHHDQECISALDVIAASVQDNTVSHACTSSHKFLTSADGSAKSAKAGSVIPTHVSRPVQQKLLCTTSSIARGAYLAARVFMLMPCISTRYQSLSSGQNSCTHTTTACLKYKVRFIWFWPC